MDLTPNMVKRNMRISGNDVLIPALRVAMSLRELSDAAILEKPSG